jgi:hypothetical protein
VGAWVGPQLSQVGVPHNQSLRNGVGRLLIDQTNNAHQAACAKQAMTRVDLRGIVSGRWWDEIHPNCDAFRDVTVKIVKDNRGIIETTPAEAGRTASIPETTVELRVQGERRR